MPDAAAVLATPASRKSESTSVVVAVRCRPFNSRVSTVVSWCGPSVPVTAFRISFRPRITVTPCVNQPVVVATFSIPALSPAPDRVVVVVDVR